MCSSLEKNWIARPLLPELPFRLLFDTSKLVTPYPLEGLSPFMEWADGFGVGAVENLTAIATSGDETNLAENAEVLRDGGLFEPEDGDDVADRAFPEREKGKNVAATRFGDSVEGVGGCGGARHGERIHTHMGICQVLFGGCERRGRKASHLKG
jgi:hypothetical protein